MLEPPNHPHCHAKCLNHLNLPYNHTLNPKKTTNPHGALWPSATLHTFILPSHYAPTALSRLCRLAISLHCSYLSPTCSFTRSGYMLGITCLLYDFQCNPNCQMEDTTSNSVNLAQTLSSSRMPSPRLLLHQQTSGMLLPAINPN